VPEAFEDIYDPVYDEYISEDNYWDEVNSVDSDEAPLPKIRYKRSSHLKEESHLISECCAKDEKKHSTSRVVDKNNSHSSISLSLVEMKNPYRILEKSWNVVEDKEQQIMYSSRMEEGILPNATCELREQSSTLCNDGMAEHESDWVVYHSKYAKKRIHKSVIQSRRNAAASNETALLALDETDVVSSLHDKAKQKWVDSWCGEDRELAECVADGDTMIISIDGYFRKNRKAGYGVIIRNRYTGVPLLASAAVYDQGKPISSLYHELQGLNKGLELAIKYALGNIFIVQRSRCIVPDIARWSSYCTDRDHVSTPYTFCKICAKWRNFYDCTEEDYQLHVYPLIEEIRGNFAMLESTSVWSYGSVKNKYNKAADYLAKLQVNKEEMKPHEFSEELKDILYEESLGGDLMCAIRQSGYGTDEDCLFHENW
ncbi:hypothetical protein MKW92_033851, partial [Papaver armeniacum]